MKTKAKMQIVASFAIPRLQYLDKQGQPTQDFPDFATPECLLNFYRHMSLARAVDNRAVQLQRVGSMGTYPAAIGQEAVGVGIGAAVKEGVYCPNYRETATLLLRGVSIQEIFQIWGGDERGQDFQQAQAREDFPINVPIATQCLHAAGVAFAFKYRQQPRVAVTSIGDGGTSRGDFYEAMNLAGTWNLPVVFVVNNNQWAISLPVDQQTRAETMAQKAIAAGISGMQVDGNDVIAVHHAVSHSIEQARAGKGPSVIEAVTYRLCAHTTADDASRYQPAEQVKLAWEEEPLARLAAYLQAQGLWSQEQEAVLQQECIEEVEQAAQAYMKLAKAAPESMFDSLYATLPEALIDQRDELP